MIVSTVFDEILMDNMPAIVGTSVAYKLTGLRVQRFFSWSHFSNLPNIFLNMNKLIISLFALTLATSSASALALPG